MDISYGYTTSIVKKVSSVCQQFLTKYSVQDVVIGQFLPIFRAVSMARPLDFGVDPKIKGKIWANQFIDLIVLLPNNRQEKFSWWTMVTVFLPVINQIQGKLEPLTDGWRHSTFLWLYMLPAIPMTHQI